MKREGVYVIVLGDFQKSYNDLMVTRLENLGEVRQILSNTYVLNAKDKTLDKEAIRDMLAGAEYCYCLVIDMTKFMAAWSLRHQDSDYMKTFFDQD